MDQNPECLSPPRMKTFEEALDLLLAEARPLEETESIDAAQAAGRVVAETLTSAIDVPPWDNSAMDGYAVRTRDLKGETPRLRVTQRIPAGATGVPLEPGTAARIFTGAPVPENADAVVIQEACERDGDQVLVHGEVAVGAHIRRAGEDLASGAPVVAAGTRLLPQHLGLAASVGIGSLRVFRRLSVVIASTGDELATPGQPLGRGQIYNSNRYTLSGLLQSLGCRVVDLGVVEDSFDATCRALEQGARSGDLVLATGGVSVGEEDHVKPAVEKLGSLDLWNVAIRPGKPLAFGRIGDTPFIGMPGNPVSLFATFCLFARPFILRLQGAADVLPRVLWGRADFDWPRAVKRREFARARLEMSEDGVARVSIFPVRSSGVMSSVVWATGFAVIPENQLLANGDMIQFIPFSELLS